MKELKTSDTFNDILDRLKGYENKFNRVMVARVVHVVIGELRALAMEKGSEINRKFFDTRDNHLRRYYGAQYDLLNDIFSLLICDDTRDYLLEKAVNGVIDFIK